VRNALASLPWVEAASIQTNQIRLQVKFTVTDRAAFDLKAVKQVLAPNWHDEGLRLLAGPTEQ